LLIGYVRVSKSDGSQNLDLQKDALIEFGVEPQNIYEDYASGKRDDRSGLEACLRALRPEDTLVIYKLDRLSRDMRSMINTVHGLSERGIFLKVLAGHGAVIGSGTASDKLVFAVFAALASYERENLIERTKAGLAAARARGRCGGRPYTMTTSKLRLAMASMGQLETKVGDLCRELGITRQSLYRYVSPTGELRADGQKLMAKSSAS
jgi:DNA invertase Pin-like site-specific DNA recombinase